MMRGIAITGPTASGKTSLSIFLADALGGEIISMDSMQIYEGMDIGTAKATVEEQAKIPHHLLDICKPSQAFSAKDYRDAAIPVAKEICSRGKIPIFVGGTGLYLSTLMRNDSDEVPPSDKEFREKLLVKADTEEGRIALWKRLEAVDSESAGKVHYNNARRVIRALEIYEKTGKTKSFYDKKSLLSPPEINITHITVDFHDRETLYERINERVDAMMRAGLWEEVSSLYEAGELQNNSTAAQAIGYKEIIRAITERKAKDAAVEEIKQASRNYAKRQLTWFRKAGAAVLFADGEDGRIKSGEEIFAETLEILCAEGFNIP